MPARFTGRLPEDWRSQTPSITVDRDEIVVVLHLPDFDPGPEEVSEAERSEARCP